MKGCKGISCMCISHADAIHYSAGDGRQKSFFRRIKNMVTLGISSLKVLLYEAAAILGR